MSSVFKIEILTTSVRRCVVLQQRRVRGPLDERPVDRVSQAQVVVLQDRHRALHDRLERPEPEELQRRLDDEQRGGVLGRVHSFDLLEISTRKTMKTVQSNIVE